MITLEEQLRRYAADVAGPARGHVPPLRDGGRGPTPVGRLVLVAVLVVFVAGFAWLVVRASGTGHEQMVPAGPEVPAVPEPTSWADEPGMCTPNMAGIPLHGPDGEGLCLGIDTSRTDGFGVADVQSGIKTAGMVLTPCDTIYADWGMNGFSPGEAHQRRPMHFTTSPKVDLVIVPLRSERRVVARAFDVPGLDGIRFFSYWIDPGDDIGGPVELYTADGEAFVPVGERPALPADCAASQPGPLVPTPSDSAEWESPVLDHQGQVRGRTAGLVELSDGIEAYRVVDDADQLVGYTLLDQAIGFVDPEQAEDPDRLRAIVDCGEGYASDHTVTAACSAVLSTIGIHIDPATPP